MADDIQSNIKINVDTTSAMDSIRLLQNQISAFHQQMSKMGAASAADSRNMQQNLINSINATGAFTANMTKVKTTAEQFSLSLEKNKLSMGEYFRYAGGATKTFGKLFQSEFETINKVARERVKDLQSQYIKLGRDASGAMQAIKVRPLMLDMENLGTKTQIAAQRQQLLNQLLKQGSTNLLNFGKNTQWAGRQLMVGFTIPLSIMGSAAMRAYKDIEEAGIRLKRVYGDLGTTNMETEKMVKQVQQLALEFTKYGVAVKDSMDMAATAAATGKQGAELLAQVSSAAKLAVLGGVDQQKALQTTISLTDAFGVSTQQLAKDINFLNAVENQTVLSIDDMTTAIPKAAPVIQQLGGDVKDLAFFLTAMKEGGINASEGANAIKSGLASLINPTNTASKMLQGFGINLREIVQGNKGDVKKTVIDFAKALDGLDPLNRAKAIEQLFGKFQFARMSTLFKNVIEQGSQASEVLRLASKSALELSMLSQKELNKIQQSPLYKFQKAIADFQAQLAPVGEQFMKALTPIINFGTDVLKNFNNLGEGVKGFIVKFVAIAGVVGPVLLMSFGLIANAVANVIKGFALMKDIFNKTGKSSMSLGDQVNYMTNEQIQAAAIASSLDQVHSKLKQTFTSEAAAVDMLTAAYQRSVAAQSAFAVPITPRGPVGKGPVKKYAAGGIISGPGTGTSDSILAMVSNGEAIIPAASVARNPEMVRQLVSGNIPGFKEGTEFAHIGDRKQIGAQSLLGIISENPSIVSPRTEQVVTGLAKVFGDKFLVNIYAKLGMRTGQTSDGVSINNLLGKQGVSKEEFLADFDKQGTQRWRDSLKYAGLKMKDVSDELTVLDTAIREEVVKLESGTIRDRDVKTAYDKAIKRIGNSGIVVPAFDTLSKTAGEARVNLSQRVAASAGLLPVAGGGSKGAIDIDGMKLRKGGDRFTFYSKQGFSIVGEAFTGVKDGMIRGIKLITRQKSPSKDAFDAGANIGKGAIQGVQSQIDDAKNAGTQVGQAAAQGVSQSGRVPGKGGNRVSSDGNMIFLPGQGYVSEGQIARDEALANAPMQGPKQSRLQKLRSGMNADAIYKRIQGADQEKLATGIRNRAFGASGALAVGSMVVPGEAGQMMGMASMLTSFGGMGAGGIAKGLKSLSPNMISLGLKFTKLIPYVGAAVMAFEAFDTFVMPLIKKNSKAYEAIANTLSITQGKLDKINNFFGTELKLTGVRGTTIASGDQTKAEATIAEQFQKSQEFKDLYEEDAKEMAKLTNEQFRRAMEAMAMDLAGQGLDPEGVTAIVDAIAISAGKTRVSVSPELFSIANPETKALMQQNIKSAFSQISEGAKGVSPEGTLDPRGRTLDAATGAFDNYYLTPVDPESVAKVKAGTAEIASYMSALSGQFANGQISVKEFNVEYGKLISLSTQQPGTSGIEAMRAAMILLNAEIGNAMRGLNDVQFGVWQEAITAGVTPTKEALDAAAYATQDVKDAYTKNFKEASEKLKANRAEEQKLTKQIKSIQNSSTGLANTEQKVNDKYDKRIAQIEKIKKLNEQIAKSQQGQLTLAEALNRGDIAAAARAAVDVQNNDIQTSLDNQKDNLEEARKAELAPLKGAQEANTSAVNKLTAKIEKLNTEGVVVKNPPGETGPALKSSMGNDPMGWLGLIGNAALDVSAIGIFKNLFTFLSNPGGFVKEKTQQYLPPGTAVTQDGRLVPQRPTTPTEEKASGGYIRGAGTGTSDDIPAMLSNGEYVIRANAVKTIGVDTLNKLNQADKLGFAAGGMVDKFKKKKPKPKPYTLDDLRKPISRKDDPDWYDYTNNFLEESGIPFVSPYKWSDAHQGFYRGQSPSSQRGVRDILDVKDGKVSFTSVAGAIKYYKALVLSRRQAPKYISTILGDNNWTGYGDKQGTARANSIYNRMFGKYNGLDKAEAKVLASAMTRLWGKDSVAPGFKALGLSSDLLTKKPMFKDWDVPGQKSWDSYTKNNKEFIPPTLSPNTPKYAMGGMVRHFKGGGYNGYADGGFVGPRPAPQWDEKGRWVVSRGESYWSTAEETLPGGMTIGPWWSRILKSNVDPDTGKERRLYRNSRIWIPGSKQPYPPKIGIPRTINEKKPLYMGGMPFRGIGENHLGFMGVGGFGIMKQYANGGLVGYQDGGLVGSLFGDTQGWLNNLILSMFGSGGNPSAGLNATSADAIKTGVKEGKNFTRDYIFDPTNPVDYAMAAIPGGKIVQGIGKGVGKVKNAAKTKIATMNAKKVLGIMGGKEAAKLSPQISVKMRTPGLEKFINENAYKTLHQGVKSSAGDSPDIRNLVENATGMNKALKLKPGQSPAYGFLGVKEAVPYYHGSIYGNSMGQSAEQYSMDIFNKMVNPYGRGQQLYGSTVLNLNPSALKNATVSFGDSLSIYQQAVKAGVKTPQVMKLGSLLTTLKLSSMARKTKGILGNQFQMPYAEIHMKSGFGLDDVSGIGVSNEFKDRVPEAIASVEALLAQTGKSGIPVHDIIGRGKDAFERIGMNVPKPGKYSMGGMIRAAGGGMMINGQIAGGYNMGGMVPRKFAMGGYAMGTDTVPAMLTPGEFVIKKSAVDRIGSSTLNKINRYAEGGLVGGMSAAAGESVYNNNTYEINVNVSSNSNPDQIANAVMTKIRQVDNKRVRGSAF